MSKILAAIFRFFDAVGHFFGTQPDLRALFAKPAASPNTPAAVRDARLHARNRRNGFFFLFFPVSILYMEILFRILVYGAVSFKSLIYALLFAGAFGFFVGGVALLLPLKVNRIFTGAMLCLSTLLIGSQFVYFRIFQSYWRLDMLGLAAGAIRDFFGNLLDALAANWFGILLLFVPLIYFLLHKKDYSPAFNPSIGFRLFLIVLALLLHLLAVGLIGLDNGALGDRHYYKYEFNPSEAVGRFGVLTDLRLDLHTSLFGTAEEPDDPPHGEITDPFDPAPGTETESGTETTAPGEEDPPAPIEYGDNVTEIDFETLIANEKDKSIRAAHEYFAAQTPTKKNPYTGMFAGKNIIYITLEGFTYKAADKDRTPTLYKMLHEGIEMNNFYNSLWGGSTATGEYITMTGLFHNSAKCLEMSGKTNMYYAVGNQFARAGYFVCAFHNHNYTYYSRDVSHPNFGFGDRYIAIGNGLEKLAETYGVEMRNCWPRSDLEMAQATLPYYIDSDKPFCAYYMTVSGHANYNFPGNSMATKHKDIVADLPYSDGVKAYLACQYEVELMLDEMVRQLDAAGKLNDTVFVMNADHYPYALADSELAELYGLPEVNIHQNFDLLRNGCVIWCASMKEPIRVDAPCSAMDIVPTVSNLFGLEYDSRLLPGVDILSGATPLVILNQDGNGSAWNWINKYGEYHSATKTFIPYDGYEASEEELDAYVKQMNSAVSQKNKYSHLILEKNYYAYLFK